MLDQLPDEPSAPHQRSLLSCPACATPCALGFAEIAICPSCQARVPLPREMLAERDRRRQQGRLRQQGDLLLHRALSTRRHWWRSPLFIAPLSFVAPFLAAIAGYFCGYKQGHYGQAGFVWLSGIGVLHLLTSSLLESRKDEVFRGLLLCRQPARQGGPPSCRVCSAPLSIEPNIVRIAGPGLSACSLCDGCGADNIIGPAANPASDPNDDDNHDADQPSAPRPDLFDAEAAFREVYGDVVNQRASRLYPLTLFAGFLILAVLSFYAVEAPRGKLP